MNYIETMKMALEWYDSSQENRDEFIGMIKSITAIAQGESEPLTSFDAEFMAALNGSKGDLDAWLECNNEAEVRSFMKRAIERGVK